MYTKKVTQKCKNISNIGKNYQQSRHNKEGEQNLPSTNKGEVFYGFSDQGRYGSMTSQAWVSQTWAWFRHKGALLAALREHQNPKL